MVINMTLQQLKYITTVAEIGNITEAAEKLFISQPSLTNAIQVLENELNVNIFIRSNKGVTVTGEGEEVLSYARQILEQAALLHEKFGDVKEAGRVTTSTHTSTHTTTRTETTTHTTDSREEAVQQAGEQKVQAAEDEVLALGCNCRIVWKRASE